MHVSVNTTHTTTKIYAQSLLFIVQLIFHVFHMCDYLRLVMSDYDGVYIHYTNYVAKLNI